MPFGKHPRPCINLFGDDIVIIAVSDEVFEVVVEEGRLGDPLDVEEATPPKRHQFVVVRIS